MRNRTESINVRVFNSEKSTIRRKAKKVNMSLSEYLRVCALEGTPQPPPQKELAEIYGLLEQTSSKADDPQTVRRLCRLMQNILKFYCFGGVMSDGSHEDLADP